ncbi:unnamed protein product [Notodromas monacha]|uniref:Uncharacterized protein n=1 Tax=Notodromas monacha TaxID=399045 RepID=A0A7R9BDR3_9CRUS|nr:unnamed protein product [Notodromas monacha]CAG0913438.1 unnamed protein product [Notodromas monacha]
MDVSKEVELDEAQVVRWLDAHPDVLCRYLLEAAPSRALDAALPASTVSSTLLRNPVREENKRTTSSKKRIAEEEELEKDDGEEERRRQNCERCFGLCLTDIPALSDFDLMTIRDSELHPPIARPELFVESPESPPRRARFHSVCAEMEACSSGRTRFAAGSCCGSGRRRLSMKELRKCASLPPSTSQLLSLLMESRVQVPTCHSPDAAAKRRLKRRSPTHCFLELVRDISTELSVETLCARVSINVGVLAESEPATVLLAVTRTASIACDNDLQDSAVSSRRLLVPAPNTAIQRCRPTLVVPWGTGVLGRVAESGERVIFNAPHSHFLVSLDDYDNHSHNEIGVPNYPCDLRHQRLRFTLLQMDER